MYSFSLITLEDLQKIEYCSMFPGSQVTWITDWYETFKEQKDNDFGFSKRLFIVTVYKENTLVAIVPLIKLTRVYFKIFKLQFLEFLGQQWSGMGYDIIQIKKLENRFTSELTKWLSRNISYHFIFFKYLPGDSILKSKFRLFKYAGAPFVNTSNFVDYKDFSLNVYARKFREDLRRTKRRIEKDGLQISIEQRNLDKQSLLWIQKISASKTTDGKSNLYENQLKADFHLRMYRQNSAKVVFVKFNNKPVAYGTTIDFNGQRIGIDAAFDRQYRKYGVGIHCIDQVIRCAFSDGIKKLSFGLGMDIYKFQFTNCIEEFYMCYDYKIRFKTLLVMPFFKYKLEKTHRNVKSVLEKFSKSEQNFAISNSTSSKPTFAHEKKYQHSNSYEHY